MKIDMTKTYRTRDGREVRIYAVDGAKPYPVHGAINRDGEWCGSAWTQSGYYKVNALNFDDMDLIEVKPRIQRKVWVNVFPGYCRIYTTRQNADHDNTNRIACVEIDIDVEEGHGL